jgi:DNA-binding NarL/FixJ family response regulator
LSAPAPTIGPGRFSRRRVCSASTLTRSAAFKRPLWTREEALRPNESPAGSANGPASLSLAAGRTRRPTIRLLAGGWCAAATARRLGISERTVHKHLENLYRKLGLLPEPGRAGELQTVAIV